jgi:hypothetical protein
VPGKGVARGVSVLVGALVTVQVGVAVGIKVAVGDGFSVDVGVPVKVGDGVSVEIGMLVRVGVMVVSDNWSGPQEVISSATRTAASKSVFFSIVESPQIGNCDFSASAAACALSARYSD